MKHFYKLSLITTMTLFFTAMTGCSHTNTQINTSLCNPNWYRKATTRDVKTLLNNGASVNEACKSQSPLKLASQNNASPSVILELLHAGADLYFNSYSKSSDRLDRDTPIYTLVRYYCNYQRNERQSVCDKVRAEANKSICNPIRWRNIHNGQYSIEYLRHLIFINADCGKGNRPLHIALQELPKTPLKRENYNNLSTLMDIRDFNPSIKNDSGQSITDLLKLRFDQLKTHYSNLLQKLCSDQITVEEYNHQYRLDDKDYRYEWQIMAKLPHNKDVLNKSKELQSKLRMEMFGTDKNISTLQKKKLCAKHK